MGFAQFLSAFVPFFWGGVVERSLGAFPNPEQLAFGGKAWGKSPQLGLSEITIWLGESTTKTYMLIYDKTEKLIKKCINVFCWYIFLMIQPPEKLMKKWIKTMTGSFTHNGPTKKMPVRSSRQLWLRGPMPCVDEDNWSYDMMKTLPLGRCFDTGFAMFLVDGFDVGWFMDDLWMNMDEPSTSIDSSIDIDDLWMDRGHGWTIDEICSKSSRWDRHWRF